MLNESALHSLKMLLPKGQVFTDRATMLSYEADAGLDRGLPDGVVLPRNAEDVARVVRWAAEHDVPLVARGAGTGLSGGAVADRGGIIVEFARMNRVVDIDAHGRSVIVEPALINLRLDERAKTLGLYFPPDPASQRASTIGGNVAENSGDPHCFKYGVTTNYVTGMDVVLANGQAIRVGGRALDYPEYDLCGLITGSEGMLCLMTSIMVRLVRNPPAVKTMLAIFDSVEQAGNAVSGVIAAGLVPATMELMEQNIMRMVEPFAQAGLPLDAGAVLIIEVDGYPESLDAQAEEIVAILNRCGVQGVRVAHDEEERTKIWFARKSVAGAITRLSPSYYTVDTTVPRSRLAETLVAVNSICARYGIQLGHLLHAGDGNLHPMLLIPEPENPEFMEHVHKAGWEIVEVCLNKGGTLSGEHGVGIEKRNFMTLMHKPAELLAMWDVKQAFDPNNLLNPGKVFPVPARDESGPFAGYADRILSSTYNESDPAVLINKKAHYPGSTFAPASSEEAAEGLLACTQAHLPIVIGNPPIREQYEAICLDTSELNGIKAYAPDDLYITAGAGTPLTEIQDFLAKDGKHVALASPWPAASIGGIVSTNTNAPLRMRYGSIRDLVLCATVALPDGRVIRTGRPLVKNVAGYDLTKAFIGAHGTLGLLTNITLKVSVQPRVKRTLLLPLDDLRDGLRYARHVLPLALTASAILLCKGHQMGNYEFPRHAPYLLVYSAEGLPQDVEAELAQVRQVLKEAGAPELEETIDETGTDIWKAFLSSTSEIQVRIGLPPADLPAYILDHAVLFDQDYFIADIASGLLYVTRFSSEPNASDDPNGMGTGLWLKDLRKHATEGYAVVIDMPDEMAKQVDPFGYPSEGRDIMRALKARWDPSNILNRGFFL